jgi:hypothetical protein
MVRRRHFVDPATARVGFGALGTTIGAIEQEVAATDTRPVIEAVATDSHLVRGRRDDVATDVRAAGFAREVLGTWSLPIAYQFSNGPGSLAFRSQTGVVSASAR